MKRGQHSTPNLQPPTPRAPGDDVWVFSDENTSNRKHEPKARLLELASPSIGLSKQLPPTCAGNHLAGQMLRFAKSPYPNHGKSKDTESREDFIHKPEICVKKLREACRGARLIRRKNRAKETVALVFVSGEAEELIRNVFASVRAAKENALAENRQASRGTAVPRAMLAEPWALSVRCWMFDVILN